MKSTACAVLTIILAAAMVQAAKKPKPKFCLANNIQYEPGQGYTEGCTKFTCVKKRKKIKWTSKPVPGCESEPDLAANVTAIEASIQFLNGSMESMERKMEALQTSVESILGMITAMQSTSSKLEVNITSNMDAISSNKEAISSNKETCLAIETTAAQLETCLGDVKSEDCPLSENGKISVVDAIKGNTEDIEVLETPNNEPKFNLVMTLGYNSDGTMATSDIISPGGVCSQSIPPLPAAVTGSRSVYFNNKLMVCGGYVSEYKKQCYELHDSNSQWTEGPAMNSPNYYFSMTKVGQDLYSLGGQNDGVPLDSMEKLSESSGEWTMMDQKLTSPRSRHCTVFMETTGSLVIIGGYRSSATDLVEDFNLATSSWKELAPLPIKLMSHSCAQLGETIVVTGGSTVHSGAGIQKNVYTFAGGQWETTGELQGVRYYHSMGTLDNKVLVLGGHDGLGGVGYLDTIEEMQQDGSFQITEWKLNEKRSGSGITQVPRKMFQC